MLSGEPKTESGQDCTPDQNLCQANSGSQPRNSGSNGPKTIRPRGGRRGRGQQPRPPPAPQPSKPIGVVKMGARSVGALPVGVIPSKIILCPDPPPSGEDFQINVEIKANGKWSAHSPLDKALRCIEKSFTTQVKKSCKSLESFVPVGIRLSNGNQDCNLFIGKIMVRFVYTGPDEHYDSNCETLLHYFNTNLKIGILLPKVLMGKRGKFTLVPGEHRMPAGPINGLKTQKPRLLCTHCDRKLFSGKFSRHMRTKKLVDDTVDRWCLKCHTPELSRGKKEYRQGIREHWRKWYRAVRWSCDLRKTREMLRSAQEARSRREQKDRLIREAQALIEELDLDQDTTLPPKPDTHVPTPIPTPKPDTHVPTPIQTSKLNTDIPSDIPQHIVDDVLWQQQYRKEKRRQKKDAVKEDAVEEDAVEDEEILMPTPQVSNDVEDEEIEIPIWILKLLQGLVDVDAEYWDPDPLPATELDYEEAFGRHWLLNNDLHEKFERQPDNVETPQTLPNPVVNASILGRTGDPPEIPDEYELDLPIGVEVVVNDGNIISQPVRPPDEREAGCRRAELRIKKEDWAMKRRVRRSREKCDSEDAERDAWENDYTAWESKWWSNRQNHNRHEADRESCGGSRVYRKTGRTNNKVYTKGLTVGGN